MDLIKKTVTSVLILICWCGWAEAGPKILVVQSLNVAPYEEALAGFQTVCPGDITKVILSNPGAPEVSSFIRSPRPELILTIGMDALMKAKSIKNIPIIYAMVLNPQTVSLGEEERNISGISMNLSAENQVQTIREVLPKVKKIGVLYNPERSRNFVVEVIAAANRQGINLVCEKVESPKEVPALLKGMQNQIDAFWLVPDITVCSAETVEYLLLFFLENQKPVISFSEKYVEFGALMAISIDPFDIGKQAGELAIKMLTNPGGEPQRVEARKPVIVINKKVAKKLGLIIDARVLARAKVIE